MLSMSGITASPEVKSYMADCKNSAVRLIRAVIVDETIVCDKVLTIQDTGTGWKLNSSVVDADKPCFLFLKLDDGSDASIEWAMVNYIPDQASVRQKMLYASTKAAVKRDFGSANIKYDFLIYCQTDVCHNHLKTLIDEEDKNCSDANESVSPMCPNHRTNEPCDRPASVGLRFPMENEAVEALIRLRHGKVKYVRLVVDESMESIKLEEERKEVNLENVNNYFRRGRPRFHVLSIPATVVGTSTDKTVFLYSLPSMDGSTVKQRMLYSGCKGFVTELLQSSRIGLKLDVKSQVDEDDAVDRTYLVNLLKPEFSVNFEQQKQFCKPKGPSQQRGQRRL